MTGEKKQAATRFHKRALMEAADRLIVEHGYDGMNMNMLAKEAGYSKATVYVYFESKDEIVRALTIERLKLMRSELAVMLKSDLGVAEKLSEVRRLLLEFAKEDGTYFDFAVRTCGGEKEPTGSQAELDGLVEGIMDDLEVLADKNELKEKWYAFYGKLKTQKMFDFGDGDDGN